MAKAKASKDRKPQELTTGDEVRTCGPIDENYDPETEQAKRLGKQHPAVDPNRSGY